MGEKIKIKEWLTFFATNVSLKEQGFLKHICYFKDARDYVIETIVFRQPIKDITFSTMRKQYTDC
jgi:hypothetical protein